jgi:predicted nucleic acid-binding protein
MQEMTNFYAPLKVLFDNNIILDLITKREPGYKESSKLLFLAKIGLINAYVTISQIPSIIYIAMKELKEEDIRVGNMATTNQAYDMSATEILRSLLRSKLLVASVDAKTFEGTFTNPLLPRVGFEDALLDTFSDHFIDLIVTRDKTFKKVSKKGISPTDLITLLEPRFHEQEAYSEVAVDLE